jgi:hypothetical protein
MTIAEFTSELIRLIKKSSIAGLSSNAIADELTDATEHLTSNGANDDLAGKVGSFHSDPVGDVIASHRP